MRLNLFKKAKSKKTKPRHLLTGMTKTKSKRMPKWSQALKLRLKRMLTNKVKM